MFVPFARPISAAGSRFSQKTLSAVKHSCNVRDTFDNVERHSESAEVPMLDENTRTQRLAAEFIGTAFLVFIGVGSVPATLIVNGKPPFTHAHPGQVLSEM